MRPLDQKEKRVTERSFQANIDYLTFPHFRPNKESQRKREGALFGVASG